MQTNFSISIVGLRITIRTNEIIISYKRNNIFHQCPLLRTYEPPPYTTHRNVNI